MLVTTKKGGDDTVEVEACVRKFLGVLGVPVFVVGELVVDDGGGEAIGCCEEDEAGLLCRGLFEDLRVPFSSS